ncbi:MAG: PrsW family glutamic-type intramembrane protease [Actinomycetota bacterium]
MALIQAASGGAYALSLAVVVAAVYLTVVRFMDLNEKEPLWAVALVFFSGFVAAAILPLLTGSAVLTLSVLWGPVAASLAKFAAFALSLAALAAVARARGWSEINGLMDGVVYGTAVGFGFATGEAFIRELFPGGAFVGAIGAGPLAVLWTTALAGLSDGLFGAIIGAGFGAAVGARSTVQRVAYPVAGLVGAILAHMAYAILAQGNALGGTSALVRAWIALFIPLLFVAAVVILALLRERRAITEELADESETGAVSREDLTTLRSFLTRRSRYAGAFIRGDFDGWLAMRELHNRQVQLALAKRRAAREPDPERRAEIETEVRRLRASILETKHEMQGPQSVGPDAGKAGA